MSLQYCYDCLEREDNCECKNESGRTIFGELRVAYLRGYRDASEGKEENI